jgi:hypothetical protein
MKVMKGNEGHEEELFWKTLLKKLQSRNFYQRVSLKEFFFMPFMFFMNFMCAFGTSNISTYPNRHAPMVSMYDCGSPRRRASSCNLDAYSGSCSCAAGGSGRLKQSAGSDAPSSNSQITASGR